jgi:hypothetical protein
MIDALENHVATSRLGCQIHVDRQLEGARIRVLGNEG